MFPQNAASRRVRVLIRILQNINFNVNKVNVRAYTSEGVVSIGEVTKEVKTVKNSEYVPRKYYTENVNQNTLHHLRWMMQKDLLGQDVFLLGPPGPKKRNLAMQYIELTNREHEYVALSRDTTESDLKQRREIISGTATYFDQSAVKAATEGRVLVLEGIEKAERNVLPVLNNLLENREMHLEDGRLLIPATRYDKLLKDFSKEELDKWKLVRVDENFRVIALGLPVPKYRGNPLDPPLRSRFQARDVHNDSYKETAKSLNLFLSNAGVCDENENYPVKFWCDVKTRRGMQIVQANITLPLSIGDNTSSNCTLQLLRDGIYRHVITVTDDNFCLATNRYLGEFWYDIERNVNIIPVGSCPIPKEWLEDLRNVAPTVALNKLELLLSAAFALLSKESATLGLPDFPIDSLPLAALILEQNQNLSPFNALYRLYPYRLFLKDGTKPLESLLARLGINPEQEIHEPFSNQSKKFSSDYIETGYQNTLIEEMYQTANVADLCIIGPKGCGKNLLVSKVAERLNTDTENIILYQDMTSRDLLQQRTTLDNGDTIWKFSPLVDAALEGRIAIIDGIHRIHPSTLSVLHRLVHNREIQLYDGKRLINEERYKFLQERFGLSHEQLSAKGVLKIHPKFRIMAIGEPPSLHSALGNWLSPEVLSLFVFHEMRTLKKDEEIHVITEKHGPIPRPLHQVIDLANLLRNSQDLTLKTLSGHLSTRQLMRIAARLKLYPTNDAYEIVQDTFMMQFLPPLARQALENVLAKLNIMPSENYNKIANIKYEVTNNVVTIGKTSCPVYQTDSVTKVPSVLFYDVPQHLFLMEKLLQDFHLKEHLLIVGNQGVGKNKIVDRFLELLNRPREYIQLHRDTTVQTLTIQPTVKDGLLVHEDSPLVKAIKHGHVLVIDEADKAPTHVTCILKSLVESGQMILSDGRRIVKTLPRNVDDSQKFICIHPDFRIIVLANRPGFPFLGNDFFGALGDLFSSHAVDNPSEESEISLLKQYGPNVPDGTIQKLVKVFGELRLMADQGLVNYPYSTREVVNIVKHLQLFPDADLEDVIFNVFDFDRYSPEVVEVLGQVLTKHGFSEKNVLSSEYILKKRAKEHLQVTVDRYSGLDTKAPKHGKEDPKNDPHVGGNTWAGGTGGRDTAGLGGKGGPYRLDKGHKVHQLSDEEKAAVPEHIQKAAREMGKKAFQEKLREIGMSGYDATLYSQLSGAVSRQVQSLRGILGSLEAKNKERYWTRHQTTGELDDVKLIDGLLGEKTIFRRRTEQIPELGTPQLKPKLLRLVVDVSGSMYRFNSYDGRLDRELEAVVLVMEAFEGFQDKILYDVKGHSGDTHDIEFVNRKNPPKNNKERLEVIRLMHAHSQYCWSGDNTLPATELAISTLSQEECDEAIVVVLSDANLQRYGIPPSTFGKALTSCPNVNAYAIFLGGLGNQAEKLTERLPAGRAFICTDLDNLPQILKQIFSSTVMNV